MALRSSRVPVVEPGTSRTVWRRVVLQSDPALSLRLRRPYHAAVYDIDTKALETDYSTASVHEDENGKVKYVDSVINTGNIY